MATQWYQTHLGGATRVLLLTNDRENKRKANEEGISAETGLYNILSVDVYPLYVSSTFVYYLNHLLVEFLLHANLTCNFFFFS